MISNDEMFFRIGFQGKVLSQIVAYIWRWADDETDSEKAAIARELKEYFTRANKHEAVVTALQDHKAKAPVHLLTKAHHKKINENLKSLFGSDPRGWLENPSDEPSKEVKLLIAVFGEDRIKNDPQYLSPLFDPSELGEVPGKENTPHYEFLLDVSSFIGTLHDPDLERPLAFRYHIAFPPRPELGEATVTTRELDNWIVDQDRTNIYPNNPYIPVSTT